MSDTEQKTDHRPPWRPWITTTYFAEGFPYSVVRQISSVFFKDSGASLQAIGMTSLYGLPWVLKFLWAPFVDEFSTKRRWLLFMEACLTAVIFLMATGSTLPRALPVVAVLFLVTAILSATHDISIDGFYLEALDRHEQAKYVGFQAMSYRIALIAGGGGIVFFSGLTSWWGAFLLASAIMGLLLIYHTLKLPRIEQPRRSASAMLIVFRKPLTWFIVVAVALGAAGFQQLSGSSLGESGGLTGLLFRKIGLPGIMAIGLLLVMAILAVNVPRLKRRLYASDSFYALAFVDYLDQPKVGIILSFVVLYRTGESFLLNMLYPFFRDIGISRAQYGLAYGTFGIAASIAGGLLGGWLISRFGLRKVIWPMVLSQNLLNLLYMALAFFYQGSTLQRALLQGELARKIPALLSGTLLSPVQIAQSLQGLQAHAASPYLVTIFIILEAFGAGLGTAVFMVFIMRTCKPRYKAAHMSIATSIMQISATLAGVFSGFLAAWLGFAFFFGFTFLATVPGMALIFFLPYLDNTTATDYARTDPPAGDPAGS